MGINFNDLELFAMKIVQKKTGCGVRTFEILSDKYLRMIYKSIGVYNDSKIDLRGFDTTSRHEKKMSFVALFFSALAFIFIIFSIIDKDEYACVKEELLSKVNDNHIISGFDENEN